MVRGTSHLDIHGLIVSFKLHLQELSTSVTSCWHMASYRETSWLTAMEETTLAWSSPDT